MLLQRPSARGRLLAILCLAASGCAHAPRPAPESELVFLGDSLTHGGAWVHRLAGRRVRNCGVPGLTAERFLASPPASALRPGTHCFVMFGVNDLTAGRSEEEIVGDIFRIVADIKMRSPGTVVVLQSVLPVNPGFRDFVITNERIRSLNARINSAVDPARNIFYLDLHPLFADGEGRLKADLTTDGIHLTEEGYVIWRDALRRFLPR